ncbi:hypothetical protein BDV10DRAFT_83159 [Aspergillus recurvatus]
MVLRRRHAIRIFTDNLECPCVRCAKRLFTAGDGGVIAPCEPCDGPNGGKACAFCAKQHKKCERLPFVARDAVGQIRNLGAVPRAVNLTVGLEKCLEAAGRRQKAFVKEARPGKTAARNVCCAPVQPVIGSADPAAGDSDNSPTPLAGSFSSDSSLGSPGSNSEPKKGSACCLSAAMYGEGSQSIGHVP